MPGLEEVPRTHGLAFTRIWDWIWLGFRLDLGWISAGFRLDFGLGLIWFDSDLDLIWLDLAGFDFALILL